MTRRASKQQMKAIGLIGWTLIQSIIYISLSINHPIPFSELGIRRTSSVAQTIRATILYYLLSVCTRNPMSFASLPDELLVFILDFLDEQDLASISQVSKGLRSIAVDPEIWRHCVKRSIGGRELLFYEKLIIVATGDKYCNWKLFYAFLKKNGEK